MWGPVLALSALVLGAQAQVLHLRDFPLPEANSLSLLQVLFADAEAPTLKFQGLRVSSGSDQGIQLHLFKQEEFRPDTASWSCTTGSDQLTVWRKGGQQPDLPIFQLSFDLQDGQRSLEQAGAYSLVISNCGTRGGGRLDGNIILEHQHGYLPANEYAKYPFFLCLGFFKGIMLACWLALCFRRWRQCEDIQASIAALAGLGIAECAAWYMFLGNWNATGMRDPALHFLAVMLAATGTAVSYLFMMLASTGWGITKSTSALESQLLCRASALAITYLVLDVARQVVFAHSPISSSSFALVLLCTLPPSVLTVMLFHRILRAFGELAETLEKQGHEQRLPVAFKTLQVTMLLSVVFVLLAPASLTLHMSAWEWLWLLTDGAPQLGCTVALLGAMYLWAPEVRSQSPYLVQMDDEARKVGVEMAASGDEVLNEVI